MDVTVVVVGLDVGVGVGDDGWSMLPLACVGCCCMALTSVI